VRSFGKLRVPRNSQSSPPARPMQVRPCGRRFPVPCADANKQTATSQDETLDCDAFRLLSLLASRDRGNEDHVLGHSA
jgi:hypothetical protein